MLPPPPPGHPPIAITPDKVEIYPKKEGVKGMLPLGCFLCRGREGVILQDAAENKRIEKKEDFNRAKNYRKITLPVPRCHIPVSYSGPGIQ